MPQNNLFRNGLPHPFGQQHDFTISETLHRSFGGHSTLNGGNGLKRKENWTEGAEAGNFKTQITEVGPKAEKRVRVSDLDELNWQLPTSGCKEEHHAILNDNSVQFCHSMVAHMTPSFNAHVESNQNEPISQKEDVLSINEKQDDVEMDCGVQDTDEKQSTTEETMSGTHFEDNCYRAADVQEPNQRKPHFYIYRCRPQYYVFH